MWSLPDITRLNNRAASEKDKFEQAIHSGMLNGEALVCEVDYSDGHSGELSHELWYDIFSEDPKGIMSMCEHHRNSYGYTPEGYFNCGDCNRLMIENYTWELYYTHDGDDLLCLPCALTREIDNPANWVKLTKRGIEEIDFDRLRRARHLIGVEMPVPPAIKFYDNATFDSMDGHLISSEDMQSILTRAKVAGYRDAMLILDGGFQFAVSIGVYVKGKGKAKGVKVKGSKAAA